MPVPTRLQSRLWSKSTKQLDLRRNRRYIIEQLLRYGTMQDLRWLRSHYPKAALRTTYFKMRLNNLPSRTARFIGLMLGAQNAKAKSHS